MQKDPPCHVEMILKKFSKTQVFSEETNSLFRGVNDREKDCKTH